ncbi:GNAT family N-acetyltransferase [Tepidimicrobium xylanilyticum]|uniref:N-acetyltransferase domain-containing protein n=1 Tax=Tepidimicrobium xylanilyticum TaxID=1123352 RepID=A0A1H3CVE4_9FIRM|nr:GNAT family N-acetyltransferase [Tepidimicrobium xylanilyticum]GMG97747.1 hypothetical protein EN5CB1_25730 [Tepidimicrobium xylanilyticum]SDX58056.1 hypothetical protein SAMN05660923_02560 [Tepidimicrobium xylanilyticum]
MITLTQIDKEDIDAVNTVLVDNKIKDDLTEGIIYVLRSRQNIIGVGKVSIVESYGILKYIVVNETYRGSNYGESILRGLLFKCQSMGINKVYYHNYDIYLEKIGFKHNDSLKEEFPLILKINDFFNKSCYGEVYEI